MNQTSTTCTLDYSWSTKIQVPPLPLSLDRGSGKKILEFGTFDDAFIVVFALIYTLNLDYPRELANTFEFVQKVFIGLDDGRLKSKILTLKNGILSGE